MSFEAIKKSTKTFTPFNFAPSLIPCNSLNISGYLLFIILKK